MKALITLKDVNTSDVETRKNVHEQNFDDEVKNNKQIVVNLPLVGPVFLAKTVETGDKNRDDFHCMEMSHVMSMWFILGADWNNAQCLSRLSSFLLCKKSHFVFCVKTGYVSCLYDIVSR